MPERRSSSGGELPDHALKSLSDTFPDAVFDMNVEEYDASRLENLRNAGFEIARMLRLDGTHHFVTYLARSTPQSQVVSTIYDWEQRGLLTPGAQELALMDIEAGTFDATYERFYPRLQG